MKKTLKLIPAIAMLLISAVLVSTSTYAWFSMNTRVTATGMQVRAKAEGGIVISNESGADWKASATASHNSVADLIPTSTADVANWYHNKSDDAADAKAKQKSDTYTTVSADTKWKNVNGVQFIDTNNDGDIDDDENCYYLLNKFYIKSSSAAFNLGTSETYQDLYINYVKATGASTSAELDASLRIAIKVGTSVYIYAPVASATTSYKVGGWTAQGDVDDESTWTFVASVSATASTGTGIVNTETHTSAIPSNAATISGTEKALEVDIYIYFEGEDPLCRSEKITTTLDTLSVEVQFGITQLPTT